MYDDISLVIQGPASDREKLDFIDALPYYKSLFSEIILSTYTEWKENLVNKKKVKIIS